MQHEENFIFQFLILTFVFSLAIALQAKLKQEEVESILESCHCVDASFDIVETAPDKFLIIFSSSQG